MSIVENPTNWTPPPYAIRRSHRARRMRFRVTPKHGLEIVLPSSATNISVEALLFEHRDWIEKQFTRYHLEMAPQTTDQPKVLPSALTLPALRSTWSVEAIAYLGSAKWMERPNQSLVLLHAYDETEKCFTLLENWLREKAKETLTPWLQEVSHSCALPFKQVRIRAQETRWGSCSSEGAINLNFKLLFFPPEVVRYIMIHELCHTVHMNHSAAFWTLVEKFDVDWKKHDKLLKKEREVIPHWL